MTMALPTFWELLVPQLSGATIVGVLLLVIAIFGSPVLRVIGSIVGKISNGRVGEDFVVSLFVVGGIILVWGVSITNKLLRNTEFLLLLSGGLFLVALLVYFIRQGGNRQ
jgi:hypothetical protein